MLYWVLEGISLVLASIVHYIWSSQRLMFGSSHRMSAGLGISMIYADLLPYGSNKWPQAKETYGEGSGTTCSSCRASWCLWYLIDSYVVEAPC